MAGSRICKLKCFFPLTCVSGSKVTAGNVMLNKSFSMSSPDNSSRIILGATDLWRVSPQGILKVCFYKSCCFRHHFCCHVEVFILPCPMISHFLDLQVWRMLKQHYCLTWGGCFMLPAHVLTWLCWADCEQVSSQSPAHSYPPVQWRRELEGQQGKNEEKTHKALLVDIQNINKWNKNKGENPTKWCTSNHWPSTNWCPPGPRQLSPWLPWKNLLPSLLAEQDAS